MSEPRPIVDRARDVDLVEQVIDRICDPDEAAAMRRVLGVQAEADRLTLAHSPEPPPVPVFRPQIDHLAHAHKAVARYTAWVDSHPDDDQTPLRTRERTLRLAKLDLARLERRQ